MIYLTGYKGGIGSCLYNQFNVYKIKVKGIGREPFDIEEGKLTLINCHGTNVNMMGHKIDFKGAERVIKDNLVSTIYYNNIFLKEMRQRGYGRIINFSSVTALKGVPGTSVYSATKSALWGMTKALVSENLDKGITINNINLGYTIYGMGKNIESERVVPFKDIWNTILYIIETPSLNGANIDLNGGLL